jgi:hypothetical protein
VLAMTAFLACVVMVLPWIARNVAVSGTLLGTAGYAVAEGTMAFPGSHLMQSLAPDMTSAYSMKPYFVKLQTNLIPLLQDGMLRLGGGWVGVLFLAGLLLGLRNNVALRYFAVVCTIVFLVVTAMGRTQLSVFEGDLSTENLLMLLTPLVVIFGVAFFLTLLNQMNIPAVPVRYGVIGLMVLLLCQQLIMTLLPPKMSPAAFPPYNPAEIQQVSGWMQPDELMMSDLPWAVAWYGDRQCALTTINASYEFFQFNDYVKTVRALYLTFNTTDAKLVSECLLEGGNGWPNFVLRTIVAKQIPSQFPLKFAPSGLGSSLFLTDHRRWQTE